MCPQTNPAPDARNLIARDRVLLYTRGMDIAPERGVELSLQSMRKAGPGAEAARVMEELFDILEETGASPVIPEAAGTPLASTPPMHRTTVLPRNMEPLSLTSAVMRWLRALPGRLTGKRG